MTLSELIAQWRQESKTASAEVSNSSRMIQVLDESSEHETTRLIAIERMNLCSSHADELEHAINQLLHSSHSTREIVSDNTQNRRLGHNPSWIKVASLTTAPIAEGT